MTSHAVHAGASTTPVGPGAARPPASLDAGGGAGRRLVVALGLLLLMAAHLTVPPEEHEIHALLFNVAFVPLILAGLWFHVRGALIAGVLTSAMSLVHLFGQLAPHHFMGPWATACLIALYNVVALVTGVLSQRADDALARARSHAGALERNAHALLEAEEAMARGERLRALGDMAVEMAHEIRNPLAGIAGAAEVLAKEETPRDIRREFGKLMADDVKRLDRVVTNFLRSARPTADGAEDAVVVRDVAAGVIAQIESEAHGRHVVFRNDVPAGLAARCEASRLTQILLNLYRNAVEAQRDHGLVELTAHEDGDSLVIKVRDEGLGLPSAVAAWLRAPNEAREPDGVGLGLPVAMRLAASIGGRIELAATGRGGTTLHVVVPRGAPPAPSPRAGGAAVPHAERVG